MERSYSQNVAKAFEIADYFLLVPAILGVCLATLVSAEARWFTLLIYGIFMIGVVLLVGYFKHSRGTLDSKYFSALWITTAVYNFLLLLPCLYYVATMYQSLTYKQLSGGLIIFFLINLAIVFGYITAVVLSLRAYSFEKRKSLLAVKLNSPIP